MARIIIPRTEDWYEELALVSSYYESEFEAKFKQHVGTVFPDYYVLTLKDVIQSKGRKPRRPDLILIKQDFTNWWLVEVELEGHNLNHVMDQVRVFLSPDLNHLTFGKKLKERFDEEIPGNAIAVADLQNMVLNSSVSVLVVVDEYSEKWDKTITKEGASLCIFQVFKNTKAEEAYRIAGIYPKTLKKITHCSAYERDPNAYQVFEPERLDLKVGTPIEVYYNDRSVRFDVVELGGKIVMKFNGKFNHVPTQKDYVIYVDLDSRLILKPN